MIITTRSLISAVTLYSVICLFTIVFSGCLDSGSDDNANYLVPTVDRQPVYETSGTPPVLKNSTEMESIIPEKLPGTWEHSNNYSKDGIVTMIFIKPGDHRATIVVIDKRTEQMAENAVTISNFSDRHGGITWELSEIKYQNKDAIKGTYIIDQTLMGELIAYPQGRYLVVSYIIGENDKVVDILRLMEALRFS